MLTMDHRVRKPPNIVIGQQGSGFSLSRLQMAIENQQLPSSPLDEIEFEAKIKNKNKNDGSVKDLKNAIQLDHTNALDPLIGLDRRFSMVSIESSATTGRLLDHLGLDDEEEEIDWALYNNNAFQNKANNPAMNDNIKDVNEKKDSTHNVPANFSTYRSEPIDVISQRRGLNLKTGNRSQLLKLQAMDKRLPVTPPEQQKRAQNYAPADKFPSLQHRFLKTKLVESQPNHSQPQKELSSLHIIRGQEVTNKDQGTVSMLKNKNLILHPSPMTTPPRKFVKDFSDQFEGTPPKRRESPLIESKSHFTPRPKHIHSFSNPVNHILSSSKSSPAGSPVPNTPSPKSKLQRTPSTPVPRRSGSTSRDIVIDKLIYAKPDEVSPETRVKLAIELKKKNEPQEASYQLQLAAELGNRDAMLLYGLSLRYGYGVKKDDRQSLLWLCRAADIDLIRSYKFEVDPFELKDGDFPKKPQEPLSSTLLEIGKAYMNGWGVERDENYGIQFVEKAASLGFPEAMLEAGNIWSTKGPNRKKNMHRSASWYRLADKYGKKLVGNSWIYKSKYMEKV